MGILDRVSKAFEHPDDWLEFECENCGTVFRIERGDKQVCSECGSHEVTYLASA